MKLVGNKNIHEQLNVAIRSAIAENRPIPHTLLSGAAGCGKTSIARHIAEITGCAFLNVAYDKIKTKNDILEIMGSLDKKGYDQYGNKVGNIRPTIVFIDEVHGLSIVAQEWLGIMMEEWYVPVDEKQSKINPQWCTKLRGNVRWVPQFTLIGATTNDGALSKPFRDRFKLRFLFGTYNIEESIEIVIVHVHRLNQADQTKTINITPEAVVQIAQRGRGVPRIIVGYIERCRDYAIVTKQPVIRQKETTEVFNMLGIDSTGLNPIDIKLLLFLYEVREPVGIDNLSVVLNESKQVLLEVTEPYLIQRGFINRLPRGRVITDKGKAYLATHGHIVIEDDSWFDIPATYNRRL